MLNLAHRAGLHIVAVFETAKGLLGLIVGCALLKHLHADLQEVGMRLIDSVGLDPADHYPQALLNLLSNVTPKNIEVVAGLAFVYALVRLSEAYGLWKTRGWASWLGVISGALYLPIEFYEMYERFTWVRLAITCGNILVVIYLYDTRPRHLPQKAEGPS